MGIPYLTMHDAYIASRMPLRVASKNSDYAVCVSEF